MEEGSSLTLPELLARLWTLEQDRAAGRKREIDVIAAEMAVYHKDASKKEKPLLRLVSKGVLPPERLAQKSPAAFKLLKQLRGVAASALDEQDARESTVVDYFKQSPWQFAAEQVCKTGTPVLDVDDLAKYAGQVNTHVIESGPVAEKVARLDEAGFGGKLLAAIWGQYPVDAEAMGLPKADTKERTSGNVDDDALLSPSQLAERFDVPLEPLKKRLARLRKTDHKCFTEVAERGSREPQFLYRIRAARPAVEALKVSRERPAK